MSNIICFMDFEYTTSGDKKKDFRHNYVELLSMAGIFVDMDSNEVKDTFYEVVKPRKNKKLSNYCIELTKISQEDVDSAREMEPVINDFLNMANNYKNTKYIIWGNFDVVALRRTIKICNYTGPFKSFISRLVDIQPKISNSIKYNGIVLDSCWGLQKIRQIYGLEESDNKHNALSDAKDLWEVYVAYKNNGVKDISTLQEKYDNVMENRLLIDKRRKEKHEDEVRDIFGSVANEALLVKKGVNSFSIRTLMCNVPVEIIGCDYVCLHKECISIASRRMKKRYKYNKLGMEIAPIYRDGERKIRYRSLVEIKLSDMSKNKIISIEIPINNQTKNNIITFIESNFEVKKNV